MWLPEQSIVFTVWRIEWPCTIDCVTIRIVVRVLCDCAVSRDRPMVVVNTCTVFRAVFVVVLGSLGTFLVRRR